METRLTVDRSDMADTAQPVALAEILLGQLRPQLDQLLPLPIDEVAHACGILEIRSVETDAYEGGLIQDEVKKQGFILIKAGQHPSRTRYTVAHELGHFVNLRHVAPPGQSQLMCSKDHMQAQGTLTDKRLGIEAQANEFATNVLMPKLELSKQAFMAGSPEIQRILSLQALCNVSKEAAARRYAELHGGDFAVVFSKDDRYLYSVRGGDFPWVDLKRGQPLYRDTLTKTFAGQVDEVSEQEETETGWWLSDNDSQRWDLWEEVLTQRDGYRMTLLLGERSSDSSRWSEPRFSR